MSDFRKLKVYQKARALAKRMAPFYPRVRKRSRRLADQMERAVESIGDAIAEGRGRATDKDFAGFITTAISSSNEAEHDLERAFDYAILTENEQSGPGRRRDRNPQNADRISQNSPRNLSWHRALPSSSPTSRSAFPRVDGLELASSNTSLFAQKG